MFGFANDFLVFLNFRKGVLKKLFFHPFVVWHYYYYSNLIDQEKHLLTQYLSPSCCHKLVCLGLFIISWECAFNRMCIQLLSLFFMN
jgi:hypothetical protein